LGSVQTADFPHILPRIHPSFVSTTATKPTPFTASNASGVRLYCQSRLIDFPKPINRLRETD